MADDGHDTDLAEASAGDPAAVAAALVEQAKGILMARHGIGPAAAATRLRTAAKYARRPVEAIAGDLISDLLQRGRHTTPLAPPGSFRAAGAAPGRPRRNPRVTAVPTDPVSAG